MRRARRRERARRRRLPLSSIDRRPIVRPERAAGFPKQSPFLQLGDFGQLGEGCGRQIRETEQYRFDAGEAEIVGLERQSRSVQPAVNAKDDLLGLRPIGRVEDSSQP